MMKEKKKQLYICERPYPTYRTIIKVAKFNLKADIVLSNHVDGMEKMLKPLSQSKLFENIFFYDDIPYKKYEETICSGMDFMRKMHGSLKKLKAYFHLVGDAQNVNIEKIININEYDEIFVNDATSTLCMCLFHNKKKVTWVEHAKDTYKAKLSKSFDIAFRLLSLMELLGITFALHGFSRYVDKIEINSNGTLYCVPKNKEIVAWNIDEAIKGLSAEKRKKVYSIYEEAYNINIQQNEEYDLLLTTPLFLDGFVGSIQEQIHIFENIIKKYNEQGRCLIIKPHPRDDYDYSKEFKDAILIDRSVSSEILTLNENLSLTNVVSFYSSSSDLFGDISKELIQIGEKDLKQYL